MMKLKRPVAALLAAVLLLGLLTGCHRENGVSFRVAMGSVPATLDPALMRKRPWSAICLKIL